MADKNDNKGFKLADIAKVDAPARLTTPAVTEEPVAKPKGTSLLSQAKDLAGVLEEQERIIAALEVRVFGTQNEGEDHDAPDNSALGIRLRYLAEHAADNTNRLDALLKAL